MEEEGYEMVIFIEVKCVESFLDFALVGATLSDFVCFSAEICLH